VTYFDISGKQGKSDELYLFMLKSKPDDPLIATAIFDRLMRYARYRNITQAQKLAKEAVKIKRDFEYVLYVMDGFSYYYGKPQDLGRAIQSLRESIKIKVTFNACSALTFMLYEKGDYKEAYDYAKQALNMLTEKTLPAIRSEALDKVGWTAFRLSQLGDTEKLTEAREMLKTAYETDDKNDYARLHYGAILYLSTDSAERNKGFGMIRQAKENNRQLAKEADEIIQEIDKMRH
jgi:tetratricopeptide (TPR) repeat protein